MEKLLKVAIIGSREFSDRERLFAYLDSNKSKIEMIVSGGARGADDLGRKWAEERGYPCLIYYARWTREDGTKDMSAGLVRNRYIIEAADVVVAWWDGKSRGTKYGIDLATELGKRLIIKKF